MIGHNTTSIYFWKQATFSAPGELPPNRQVGKSHQADAQPDHRKFYLDYEGPVSNDRGNVSRWDAGTLQWLQVEPNHCVVRLDGERLRGIATLLKCEEAWTFSVVIIPAKR